MATWIFHDQIILNRDFKHIREYGMDAMLVLG